MFGNKAVVGLDLGSSVVKAVQLRRTGKSIELERYGIAEVYPNGDKGIVSLDLGRARTDAIRRALQMGKITTRNAVSSIGGEPVIVRYIQMPAMAENELRNALQWEAQGYIPYEIDEVNLDSVILGASAGNADKVDVLLVAAKKDMIARHITTVKMADLNPVCVDVEAFAFLNQFEFNYQPDPAGVIALINIGAETTSISIFRGGVSRFSREISTAGDSITSAIANKLNVNFLEAERLKVTLGAPTGGDSMGQAMQATGGGGSDLLERIRGTVERITGEDLGDDSPESMARKAIKNTLANLVSELRRSIQFYENQASGPAVNRVMIGGGGARLKNLDQYLKRELHLDVGMIDPLHNIRPRGKDMDLAQLGEHKASLGVAIGLALRNLVD